MWSQPPSGPGQCSLLAVVAITMTLLLSACSSTGATAGRQPADGATTSPVTTAGDGIPTDTADPTATPIAPGDPLPFDAVLIELFGTTDTDAYLAETERRASELIVECMQANGFEFALPAEIDPPPTPEPGDIDAAREAGFGLISGFREQLATAQPTSQRDPNREYLATLPRSEIDRFFMTLEGASAEAGQLPTEGCRAEASVAAYADWQAFRDALPNSYVLDEERDTHPEWLAARALWHDCMAERGYDYANPEAIRSEVTAALQETVEQSYPGGRLPLIADGDGFVVDPVVDDLLDELAVFEQDAAVANIECTEPVADQMRAVDALVQQAYVERNRDAIDALLAS